MKAIIQHNFTSGLGDFICDMCEYINVVEKLKSNGYHITLLISLYRNKYIDSPFIKSTFDEQTLMVFDEIIEIEYPVSSLEYLGCKYHSSSQNPQKPSIHHWDIFFDVVPNNFTIERFSASYVVHHNIYPNNVPIFNQNILDLVDTFEKENGTNYDFLHIRTSDIIDSNLDRYDNIINKIKEIIKKEHKKYYLGTNNHYIYETLKKEKNIITKEFDDYDKVDNDMNAYTFMGGIKPQSENSNLQKRIYNILTEMILIHNSKNLYFFYDINWISNFVFYGLVTAKEKINMQQIYI